MELLRPLSDVNFPAASAATGAVAVTLGPWSFGPQGGAGKVTVAPNGQTLVSRSGLFSTAGQYAVIDVVSPVNNTFLLSGDLGA